MTNIGGKWLKYMGNGLSICEISYIYGTRLKYLRSGISMLQMT